MEESTKTQELPPVEHFEIENEPRDSVLSTEIVLPNPSEKAASSEFVGSLSLSQKHCEDLLDNKQEIYDLPNTDDLLDIKVIKTSLLGKEQAKKRLQAFSPAKRIGPRKSRFAEEEKPDDKQAPNKKPPKKPIHPSEKAKAVIEEIEEIKKIENAYYEALEQQMISNKHDRRRRSQSRSRSRSRERNRRYNKRQHRRSRSRDEHKSRKLEKPKYPNSWKELKDHDLQLEKLSVTFPAEHIKENKIYDFRKQLLFQAPSYPLRQFLANGINGEQIVFPADYIRFTKSYPSVPYCVNEKVPHDLFSRKGVYEYVPRAFRNVLEQFTNNSKLHCDGKSPIRTTSRKWYPKSEGAICTLLESSLGLSFLQSYSDDDEQDKEENCCNEEDIDSDGLIANILEDIDNTELLLSKNNFEACNPQEDAVVSKPDSVTELDKPKKKHKKVKKHTKLKKKEKKKKNKHKKHKTKKEKRKKKTPKVQDTEPVEQKDKANSTPKLSKHRSRSNSSDAKVLKLQKEKNKSSKLDVDTDKAGPKLGSAPQASFSEKKSKKDVDSNTETKETDGKRKLKDKNDPKKIHSPEKKNAHHIIKHKKKYKETKKHKKNKKKQKEKRKVEEDEDKDGRTSEELKRIIEEKQKILEEHTRREVEETNTDQETTTAASSLVRVQDKKNTVTPEHIKGFSLEKKPETTEIHLAKHKKSQSETINADGKHKINSKNRKVERISDVEENLLITITKEDETSPVISQIRNSKSEKCIIKSRIEQLHPVGPTLYTDSELTDPTMKDVNINKKDNVASSNKKQIDDKCQINHSSDVNENSQNRKKATLNQQEKEIKEKDRRKTKDSKIDSRNEYFDNYEESLEVDTINKDLKNEEEPQNLQNLESHNENTSQTLKVQLYSPDVECKRTISLEQSLGSSLKAEVTNAEQEPVAKNSPCPPSAIEKEIGTPNTDEYYSEWESDSDITENLVKRDVKNLSWESEEEILHNKHTDSRPCNVRENSLSNEKNRNEKGRSSNFSLDISLVQKDVAPFRRHLEERRRRHSLEHSPENFLEMPFNIKNVKRERYNWRDDRSDLRKFINRSPDLIEMDFRIRNDKPYSLMSEDSWEKNEILSIKTEELRLEQERLSLLQERRQLEIEKQRFQELEKQRHLARLSDIEDRQRKFKEKKDNYQSQRDYDQFNLNNFLENKTNDKPVEKTRKGRWDVQLKGIDNHIGPAIIGRDEFQLRAANKLNIESTNFREEQKKQKKSASGSHKKSKLDQSYTKDLRKTNKSPEVLEGEYEKFLEVLESETSDKKTMKKVEKFSDINIKNKTFSLSAEKKAKIFKSETQKRRKRKISSSSSSSSSSLSDSDSSSDSSSSSTSSSSSSSYRKRKKSKKYLNKNRKQVTSPTATMQTKAVQVAKTEIIRTVSTGTKLIGTDGTVATQSTKKLLNKEPASLFPVTMPEVPLPVPSPKVIINPSAVVVPSLPLDQKLIPAISSGQSTKPMTNVSIQRQVKESSAVDVNITKTASAQKIELPNLPASPLIKEIKTEKPDLISNPGTIEVTLPKRQVVDFIKAEDAEKLDIPPNSFAQDVDSIKRNIQPTSRDNQTVRESQTQIKEAKAEFRRSSRSPKRKREASPKGRRDQTRSPDRYKRRSMSPLQSDTYRRKDSLPRRNDYSPRRHDYSPRRRGSSPRRYGKDWSPNKERKQESIQEMLQRLAGIDNFSKRRRSPVSSPLHGFKRSVADSTISDEQLLQYRVEDHIEPTKYFNSSLISGPSKKTPLDERINQELGVPCNQQKTINTSYMDNYHYGQESQQYYEEYNNQQYNELNSRKNFRDRGRTINQNVLQPVPFKEIKRKPFRQPPLQQNEVTNTTQQIKQVGNILEIIPRESIEKLEVPQPSIDPPKIKSVSSVTPSSTVTLTTTVTTTSTTKVILPSTVSSTLVTASTTVLKPIPFVSKPPSPFSPPSPASSTEMSPTSSSTPLSSPLMDMNAEVLIKKKMERRAEKEKRKLERELKREEKKKDIEEPVESTILDSVMIDDDNASPTDTDISIIKSNVQWSQVPKIIFNSSHKPPERGILSKSSRFSINRSIGDLDRILDNQKNVKFSDGIIPGEGTSPSGGEELSSPPPAPKKLPKEKRSKKTKTPKAAKVPKRKKVKVKVVRRAEEEDEDDDLPPPPPPPGSPPPHVFPARIKTIINNIHPTVTVSIANSLLQPEIAALPPPVYRPSLNVLPPPRPPITQQGALQQHHLGAFGSSNIVAPAGSVISQVPLSTPPPPLLPPHHQHHIGHNNSNNHHQSPYLGHHHH